MRKFIRFYFFVPFIAIFIIAGMNFNYATTPFNSKKFLIIKDTIPESIDSLLIKDSLALDTTKRMRVDTFTLRLSKDSLEAPVQYAATDSVVGLLADRKIILYNQAKTSYQDLTLSAPSIELDQTRNVVIAKASKDSTGEIKDYAEMKQGENQFRSESMEYDFKTQRGLTKTTITQQGEMYVHADIVKKIDAQTMYGWKAFFTTCNLDHPHFGFRTKRAKIINKKLAVTGSVRPEFDSVPVPIYLPFGIYPLYQGRHSGFIAPSFETNDQMGLGLAGMGFYYVVNDYWDVQANANIYSYGSWQANVNPKYRKIYKYSGSFNFGLQSTRRNSKGDPDYYSSKTYTVNWSHASDMRSRPGTSFSANVNASSTSYNKNIPNNNLLNFQNVLSSSITYTKNWIDRPFNLTASANHSQNNGAHQVSISLPNIGFTMTTIYPFQRKNAVGSKKWYEQFGIGYNGSFRNGVSFYDSIDYQSRYGKSMFSYLIDTLQWGANHSIPITLTLPPILGGAVQIAPSISYSQEWVDRVTTREYDKSRDTLIASINKGFHIKQQASVGVSLNTALYGTYQFRKKARIMAMRHVIRPTVGFSYTPDMNKKYWQYVQVDTTGYSAWFNKLDGYFSGRGQQQIFSRRFGGINFGFDNNLELKVRNKKTKDTTASDNQEATRKIRLIEGFGVTGSYNIFADSMRLSDFNIYFRTNLFEKINITASANLTPYKLNSVGNRTSKYAWQGGKFSLGSITSANLSASTTFQSKPKDPAKEKRRQEQINQNLNDPMLQADQQRLMEYMRQNPAEFVDFNTPWSLSLSFNLNYYKGYNSYTNKNQDQITASSNFTGSFNLTPKWNFSVNGYYDFSTKKMQTFSMAISRDLHCWQMAINITPIGLYRFFNFTISPKSGILQDLKINRSRSFTNQ